MAYSQPSQLVMAPRCDERGRKFSSSKLLAHHQLMCIIREKPTTKTPKRGNPVGRGHCSALPNNAVVETCNPAAVQDTLAALRELDPTTTTYLKEKLEEDKIK